MCLSADGRGRGLPPFRVGPLETPRFAPVWCWWALKSWLFPLGSMAHVFSLDLFFSFCHFPSFVLACENVGLVVLARAAYGEMSFFLLQVQWLAGCGRLMQISCPLHGTEP